MFHIFYIFWIATFVEQPLFQNALLSIAATFSEELLSHNMLFRRVAISQLRFLSTATFTTYRLVTRWAHCELCTLKVWEFILDPCVSIIAENRIIDQIYLISRLPKVLGTATFSWNYFLSKLIFHSLYFLRVLTLSKQLYFFKRATFPKDAVY